MDGKMKTECCCVCARDETCVMFRCCESSFHMSCLIKAWDKNIMSFHCPVCNDVIEEYEDSTFSNQERTSRKNRSSGERELRYRSRKRWRSKEIEAYLV